MLSPFSRKDTSPLPPSLCEGGAPPVICIRRMYTHYVYVVCMFTPYMYCVCVVCLFIYVCVVCIHTPSYCAYVYCVCVYAVSNYVYLSCVYVQRKRYMRMRMRCVYMYILPREGWGICVCVVCMPSPAEKRDRGGERSPPRKKRGGFPVKVARMVSFFGKISSCSMCI